ncbi:MAG: hypothetical protein JXA73_26130, partial [Acidobacteria bacterium]|nr:hypothetical protein [Acidobacteriota bacterium]
MKILFLSRWYPYPPDNGSKIRILNLLGTLCERHSVTLISFVDPLENISTENFPSPGPAEIQVCPYMEFRPNSRRAILGFFSNQPRYLVDTYRPEMASLIRGTMDRTKFDLIVASQTAMASYYRCFEGIPAIFEEVELGCFRPDQSRKRPMVEQARAWLRWAKHRRFVADLLPNFSFCTVASEPESKMLAEIAPGYPSIHVIPNSIDLSRYERLTKEKILGSLIFTGSLRYNANLDAMDWFLRDIYPMIQSRRDDISLTITGDPGCGKLPDASNV